MAEDRLPAVREMPQSRRRRRTPCSGSRRKPPRSPAQAIATSGQATRRQDDCLAAPRQSTSSAPTGRGRPSIRRTAKSARAMGAIRGADIFETKSPAQAEPVAQDPREGDFFCISRRARFRPRRGRRAPRRCRRSSGARWRGRSGSAPKGRRRPGPPHGPKEAPRPGPDHRAPRITARSAAGRPAVAEQGCRRRCPTGETIGRRPAIRWRFFESLGLEGRRTAPGRAPARGPSPFEQVAVFRVEPVVVEPPVGAARLPHARSRSLVRLFCRTLASSRIQNAGQDGGRRPA